MELLGQGYMLMGGLLVVACVIRILLTFQEPWSPRSARHYHKLDPDWQY